MTLEEWLKWKKWSKRKFAKKNHISLTSIHNWTKVKMRPSKFMAYRIEILTKRMVKAEDLLKQKSWKDVRNNNLRKTNPMDSAENK